MDDFNPIPMMDLLYSFNIVKFENDERRLLKLH